MECLRDLLVIGNAQRKKIKRRVKEKNKSNKTTEEEGKQGGKWEKTKEEKEAEVLTSCVHHRRSPSAGWETPRNTRSPPRDGKRGKKEIKSKMATILLFSLV